MHEGLVYHAALRNGPGERFPAARASSPDPPPGGLRLHCAAVTLGRVIVTIDGSAASGKSSVATLVGRALAVPVASSGLLYRAAAQQAEEQGGLDEAALLAHLEGVSLRLDSGGLWLGKGEAARDLGPLLHSDRIDEVVSRYAAMPGLRRWVNAQLRRLGEPLVVEGRDMGSVVFPDAEHKFYLSASAAVRAARRVGERSRELAAVQAALEERDRRDAAQLAPAPDAVLLHTDDLSLAEVVDAVLARVRAEPGA